MAGWLSRLPPAPGDLARAAGDEPGRQDTRAERRAAAVQPPEQDLRRQLAQADHVLRATGKAVILISHDMPNVVELADRIHIQRLGARAAVITPKTHTMEDAVAIMTGAKTMMPSRSSD